MFNPLFIPLENPSPTFFPAVLDFPAVLLNAVITLFIADCALLPNAFRPLSTNLTLDCIPFSDACTLFADELIEFIEDFTSCNAVAIASVPTAPTVIPAPNATIPAVATIADAPVTVNPDETRISPALRDNVAAPNAVNPVAAVVAAVPMINRLLLITARDTAAIANWHLHLKRTMGIMEAIPVADLMAQADNREAAEPMYR